MAVRVGINGFGRIGRCTYRAAVGHPDIEIVAVNDLTDAATLAHLLKYDSLYGVWEEEVVAEADALVVGGRRVKVLSERDPAALSWKDLGVEVVIESTGRFTRREKAAEHLKGGAKKVIVSAPAEKADVTVVMGVNEGSYDPAKHEVISNASCTTNCLAPVASVLHAAFGIVKGLMTTAHAYTNDQVILDAPHRDWRRARAANLSIVPTTTGAAKAIGLVLPELDGKLNGIALRVPVPVVSVIDLVVELEREAGEEEINEAFREAAGGRLNGILRVANVPLVSVDFKGSRASAVVDAPSTMTVGNMAKVVAWYDNEWAYACRIVDLTAYIARQGRAARSGR